MADLRSWLTGLGYGEVRTYLNSGNATFTTGPAPPEALAADIEAAMAAALGRSVRCLVLTAGELAKIVDGNPLVDIMTDGSRMMAHVLFEPLDPARLVEHDPVTVAPTEVAVGERVIYQWCPNGLLAAPDVSGFVTKRLGATITTRNWNTVTKINAVLNG